MNKHTIKAPLNPFEGELQITTSRSTTTDCKDEIFIIDVGPTCLKMNDTFHNAVKEQQQQFSCVKADLPDLESLSKDQLETIGETILANSTAKILLKENS